MSTLLENIRFLAAAYPQLIDPELLNLLGNGATPDLNQLISLSDKSGYPVDRLLRDNLQKRAEVPTDLKLVVFDIDGVMTDGGMCYTESGDEFKKFNAKDGLGVRALKRAGFETGIISHGINTGLIGRRAATLNITRVFAGSRPKEDVLLEWCNELGISSDQTAYIGDDINDLPIINIAGFTACPADAVEKVRNTVDVVLRLNGGAGCVREWIDTYLIPGAISNKPQ